MTASGRREGMVGAARRWTADMRQGLARGARSPSPGRGAVLRVALAGPGAVVATMLVILGMALWIPRGPAGIDQIAIPLVLLPLVWAALFFHACLDRSLGRVGLVVLVLSVVNGAAIAWHVAATPHRPSTETTP